MVDQPSNRNKNLFSNRNSDQNIPILRRETSLDGPIIKQKMPSPVPHQTPTSSTSTHWRDKNKLSSQSMHSPSRSSTVNQSTSSSIQKQPLPSPTSNLNRSMSTSATALSTTDSVSEADYYQYQQQMSPPYYHQPSYSALGKAPAPLPLGVSNTPEVPLRRTVSSLSSNRSDYPLSPTDSQPMTPLSAGEPPNFASALASPSSVASSTISNLTSSSDIQIESPKNMTVVQPAKFQPYKEVTKPFEMSDFYKYSTKFRQKNTNASAQQAGATPTGAAAAVSPVVEQNSPQLPPKNANLMQQHHRASNSPAVATPYTIRYH